MSLASIRYLTKRSSMTSRGLSDSEAGLFQIRASNGMVGTLRHDGPKVLNTLCAVAGLDLHDAQERPRVVVRGVELENQRELLSSPACITAIAQKLGELESNVVKRRAESESPSIFVHGVLRTIEVEVRPRQRAVEVCDLAATVRVVRRVGLPLRALQGGHARAVLAELVAGHGQVQRGLEVSAVHFERLLKAPARLAESSAEVIDDAESVEHVRVAQSLLHQLLVVGLREWILRAVVVFVRRFEELLSPGSHGAKVAIGRIAGQKSADSADLAENVLRSFRFVGIRVALDELGERALCRLDLLGLHVDLSEEEEGLGFDFATGIGRKKAAEA